MLPREMGDIVDRFFGDWMGPRWLDWTRGTGPAIDMVEKKDEILVRADLPGMDQKDIDVRIEEGILTIKGERAGGEEVKDETCYCAERWTGKFARSLALPPGIDPDKIRAEFKHGVLDIHLPKGQSAKSKHIDIRAA